MDYNDARATHKSLNSTSRSLSATTRPKSAATGGAGDATMGATFKVRTSKLNVTLPKPNARELTYSGDYLCRHSERFNHSAGVKPFTPRTKKRNTAKSFLSQSRHYAPPVQRPKSAKPAVAVEKEVAPQRRRSSSSSSSDGADLKDVDSNYER